MAVQSMPDHVSLSLPMFLSFFDFIFGQVSMNPCNAFGPSFLGFSIFGSTHG